MKKVIGSKGYYFLITAIALLINTRTYSQGLTLSEQSYLKRLADSITYNAGNSHRIDSFLGAIYDMAESLDDSLKKDEARAFYCGEYITHAAAGVDVFDRKSRQEMIQMHQACLMQHYHHYDKGVWHQMQYLRFMFKGLFYLTMWDNQYETALQAIRAYENEILNDSTSTVWDLMDIYTVYGDFYHSMGLYDKEASMNELIRQNYTENRFHTVYDTLKYLHATQKLLEYKCQKQDIESTFALFDEYEHYFFLVTHPTKPNGGYLSVLESMAKDATRYSLAYSKDCIDKEVRFMRNAGIDSLSCPNCIFGLKSVQLEYYATLGDWKEVIRILDSDAGFKLTHLGLYVQALIKLGDKNRAINIAEIAFGQLPGEFDGLKKFHPVHRAARVKRIISSRNYSCIRDVMYEFGNDKSVYQLYLDYLIKYKALEYSISGKYSETIDFLKWEKGIVSTLQSKHLLQPDQVLVECSRLSKSQVLKTFDRLSDGVYFRSSEQFKGYPVIVDIDAQTSTFHSGLKIGDLVVSINSLSTKGLEGDAIENLFYNNINKLEVAREGVDSFMTFYSRRDSIFLLKDTIISRYVFYQIQSDNLICFPIDAANLDGPLQKKYDADRTFVIPKELLSIFHRQQNTKSLFVSPDGLLNKINIETIQIRDESGKLAYLGDCYDVHLLTSSRDLILKDSIYYENKNATLFGYPNYTIDKAGRGRLSKGLNFDTISMSYGRGSQEKAVTGGYTFKPLIGTKHEVEDIANHLQERGWDVKVYTEENALEEQVKRLYSPRVLHIATHGFFAEDIQPEKQAKFMGMDSKSVIDNDLLRSGLAFAGAEYTRNDTATLPAIGIEDGILTAEEAQYLNLDSTELVVLSACETGLGAIINGEGVYGLQRSFRTAGAESILMSLWKVDDIATEALMKNFYKHWLDDGLSKHDALWQAKLDLRSDKTHPEWAKPYYWGAFVLIGE